MIVRVGDLCLSVPICLYVLVWWLQPKEHDSVQRTKSEQEKPIDVYECLKSFMKEEELGEEDPWCVRWGGKGR